MPIISSRQQILLLLGTVIALVLGWYVWIQVRNDGSAEGFASGNGRIEATEVDIATKFAGRVQKILVGEGDFVKAGQTLARMQVDVLQAQYNEAAALHQEALHGVGAAQAQVALRESDVAAARAMVEQRQAEADAARRRLARSELLAKEGASSQQELDDDRARFTSATATVAASRAQVVAAQAAVEAVKAQLTGARARVEATVASTARIQADIADSELKSPRDGRIQFRVAQPGEVLPAGGRLLNLVDLTDVYMTIFLPEPVVGRVALGSEARIVLDAAPQFVIPARVSFVASTAQFTPKTVETASERQKLMFRVKARISPQLLEQHLAQVKTGLPGVAWIKLDPQARWPDILAVRVPE
ncbi:MULTISPECIES: HlyD family secretion protein [unclassified Pigmentiphaga]|uniref:HlyD family secretion protein n=1 Tax=unclassified Pigmentiphaga TaxID=2626614 RepID=UPI000B40B787|nr:MULTISPECIES: HlyD family efflux transporter periplasmic adaptor subunit [unclassified Pigmentiphaga]OVZ61767.1 hemolysin D [Pigmentiphaga sp. NML030171]